MKMSMMIFMEEIRLHIDGEAFDDRKKAVFEQLVEATAEAGFELIDLISASILKYGIKETKALLERNNLKLNCAICMEQFGEYMSEEVFNDSVKPQIDAAGELGAALVMLVPGNSAGSREEIGTYLVENFGKSVAYAKKYNITCVIEDDPKLNMPMCRAEELLAIIDKIPDLRIVYDTANIVLVNENPAAACKKLYEKIVHLHLKDICEAPADLLYADRSEDGILFMGCPHGSGIVDFESVIKVLKDNGYTGPAAIEFIPKEGVPYVDEFKRLFKMFGT